MSHAQHSLVANEPLCSMCVLHCCSKSCQSVFFCYAFVRRWRRFEQRGEMCACVESGFRAAWGCSSLFFVCSSSPSLPPSLPQGQVACIALSHTLPQLQESTHTFFTIYPEPAWVKTACASVSCEDGKESVCDPD